MKLNEKLKKVRLDYGYSQREFANELGISISTLQKYEYGTLNLKYETILEICDIFDIPIDEFLQEENEENKLEKRKFIANTIKDLHNKEKKEIRESVFNFFSTLGSICNFHINEENENGLSLVMENIFLVDDNNQELFFTFEQLKKIQYMLSEEIERKLESFAFHIFINKENEDQF